MSLYNVNIEKSNKSLLLRNELIELIEEKFDLNFGYWFNDLYKVKEGVVRRLKGGMSRVDRGRMDVNEFNVKFNEVKVFLESLNIEGFDIKFNKLKDYDWNSYKRYKDLGFEGNFLDYKEKCLFEEETLILKIKWSK
jgi:hypothetical protein